MDGVTIKANQWNQLKSLDVRGVPLIYLLGLSASNWPNDCKINWYNYAANNKIKEILFCIGLSDSKNKSMP